MLLYCITKSNFGDIMAGNKKTEIRLVFQIGAWLLFIMLGYLGLRGYRQSVEKLQTNACQDEIFELVNAIHDFYRNAPDYGNLDYKQMVSFKIIPKRMFREGFTEATNSYHGGIDFYYSSLSPEHQHSAFEISFQGLSQYGCMSLLRLNWDPSLLIAVAGYPSPKPAGPLDEIYVNTTIKASNIFKSGDAPYLSDEKAEEVCNCSDYDCTVVWKFR